CAGAALGPSNGAGLQRGRRGGRRGFTGPYPSTPLDERYEVVPTPLTDGATGYPEAPRRPLTPPGPPWPDALTSPFMRAEPAGRVLIASNRGPVSFTLGEDGKLTSRRGGGGMVSGVSALAGRAEGLWGSAALTGADRAA